jgi:hypothetical protein
MIEPCAARMCSVEDFLQDIDPGLQYDIVPIYDPYGPTKEDPNMQACILMTHGVPMKPFLATLFQLLPYPSKLHSLKSILAL